jgi:hypothetical protein
VRLAIGGVGAVLTVVLLVLLSFGLRWHLSPETALLLIVGAVLSFLPLPLSTAPFGIAVAWMGLILFTGTDASAEQPARVR